MTESILEQKAEPVEKLSLKSLAAAQAMTDAKLESFDNSLVKIIEMLSAKTTQSVTTSAVEAKNIKEIDEAGATYETVNPHWEALAKKIIGSALDHCEVMFPRNGGTIFTVVIKPESSNAPAEYLKMMKSDRRSREIGQEGIQGVELWCKLVAQNLKRNQPVH